MKYIHSHLLIIKVGAEGQNTLFWEEWEPDLERRWREKDRMVTDMSVLNAVIDLFGYILKYAPEDVLVRDKDEVRKFFKDQKAHFKPR
jgi:hypothetical protein